MANETSDSQIYGPFTENLTGPLTPKQQQPGVAYAPSKAGAYALFASQFLSGMQSGRRTAYERSEQKKAEAFNQFNRLYADTLSNDKLTPELKAKAQEIYGRAMGPLVTDAANDGLKQQKDNPLLHLAKQIGTAMAGPGENKAHKDFSPFYMELHALTTDPKYHQDPAAIGALSTQPQAPGQTTSPTPTGTDSSSIRRPPPAMNERVTTPGVQGPAPQAAGSGTPVPGMVGVRQGDLQQPPARPEIPPFLARNPPLGAAAPVNPTPPPPGTPAAAAQAPKPVENIYQRNHTWETAHGDPEVQQRLDAITRAGLDLNKTPFGQWLTGLQHEARPTAAENKFTPQSAIVTNPDGSKKLVPAVVGEDGVLRDPQTRQAIPNAVLNNAAANEFTKSQLPEKKPEAEQPLGARVGTYNQMLTDRWQVINPGKPLPPQYHLPLDATNKEYADVDKALNALEVADSQKKQRADQAADRAEMRAANAENRRQTMDIRVQGQLDRESAAAGKPFQKMSTDAETQLGKIDDAKALINGSAESQALGVPKVLTAVVSGPSSGVRITQPEITAILGARSIKDTLEVYIHKLSTGKKLSDIQVKQLNDLLDDVKSRITVKQQFADRVLDQTSLAKSQDEIQAISKKYREELRDFEKTDPAKKEMTGKDSKGNSVTYRIGGKINGHTILGFTPDGGIFMDPDE